MTPEEAFGVMVVGAIVITAIARKRRKAPEPEAGAGLDAVIFRWDDANAMTVRNLLAGGIHAYGRTDGGKTSSMKQVATSIMRQRSALLVLCPKNGELEEWLGLAERAGRGQDVVVVDPDHPARFNMVRHLSQGPAGIENVVRFIMEARSVIFREAADSGGESAVWKKYDEQAIKYAAILLRSAGEEITTSGLQRIITGAPIGPEQIATPQWQAGFCNEIIRRAFDAAKPDIQKADFDEARDYFLGVWPSLGDRTRGSVLMGVTATLNAMNTGLARELFGGATTITPGEAIESKKIVLVNMPPDTFGDVGRLANIGWKYLWQKEVLRRRITDESPIAGIWGDEASLWLSDFDSDYLSRCRSYRGFMVYINQSMANYEKVLPREKGESVIESLLSNFGHKLFFALGDYKTAEWAANLCGKELEVISGGNTQHSMEMSFIFGPTPESQSSNYHQSYEYLVRPEHFMSGMRTGSPVNDYQVDAILVRSGRTFSNGQPMLGVTFDQRQS